MQRVVAIESFEERPRQVVEANNEADFEGGARANGGEPHAKAYESNRHYGHPYQVSFERKSWAYHSGIERL